LVQFYQAPLWQRWESLARITGRISGQWFTFALSLEWHHLDSWFWCFGGFQANHLIREGRLAPSSSWSVVRVLDTRFCNTSMALPAACSWNGEIIAIPVKSVWNHWTGAASTNGVSNSFHTSLMFSRVKRCRESSPCRWPWGHKCELRDNLKGDQN